MGYQGSKLRRLRKKSFSALCFTRCRIMCVTGNIARRKSLDRCTFLSRDVLGPLMRTTWKGNSEDCVPMTSTQYFLLLRIPWIELVLRCRSFCRLRSWGWWWTRCTETKPSLPAVRSSRHPTKQKEFVPSPDITDVLVSWHHGRPAWGKNCLPAELNL